MGEYFGYGPSHINGLGFRVKGERPVTNEFSKSLLTDIDENGEEYYIDEFGRRIKGHELKSLNISEISFVDKPATLKTFSVIKGLEGDDNIMNEEKELKGWEDISEKELTTIRETISILNKYDLVNDLERTKEVLTKYFGEEVKKYNERCEWTTVQNQLYGYTEDDLSFISEDLEIEKSDPTDKFPSLTRQFNLNQRRLEKAYEEYAIEERAI